MTRLLLGHIVNCLLLILSGALYAVALKYFVLPSRVILTGTEGIAVASSYFYESDSLFLMLYLIFQSVLITFSYFFVSRPFAVRTSLVVLTVVILMHLLPALRFADPDPKSERLLLVIFGGLLAGVAKAFAFNWRGSTGDEDIIGAYFASKYLKPVGSIAVGAGVVSTSFGLVLDFIKFGQIESVINTLMYTSIYIFISTQALNGFYRKFKLTMFTVLTEKPEIIGNRIMSVFKHRTYTIQKGVGGKSGKQFKMLRVIITHEELQDIIDEVTIADPKGFYFHHDIEGVSNNYYIQPIR